MQTVLVLLAHQATGAAQTAVGAAAEDLTLRLLYQLVVILCVTRAVVWVSRRFLGQTDVAGEILAGLLLGPSLLALTIGVCMNTRALTELIVLNIGHDLGVLPRQVFSMLVIMAIVSTFMATPLIRWLMVEEQIKVTTSHRGTTCQAQAAKT